MVIPVTPLDTHVGNYDSWSLCSHLSEEERVDMLRVNEQEKKKRTCTFDVDTKLAKVEITLTLHFVKITSLNVYVT